MRTTSVKPMRCEIVTEGLLWIDKIASGVGIIIFNSNHRVAGGIHVLRGCSQGAVAENPAYFADTGVANILGYFRENDLDQGLSIAIAGGATLLATPESDRISQSLVDAVKGVIEREGMAIKLEGIGGNRLRSMILNIDEGKIKIS